MTHATPLSVADLERALRARMEGLLGPTGAWSPLGNVSNRVPDGLSRATIHDKRGAPMAALICSSPLTPEAMRERDLREQVVVNEQGSRLGSVALRPLDRGEIMGLSYLVYPWRRPMRKRGLGGLIDRARVSGALLEWLREAQARAAAAVPEEGAPERFREAISRMEAMGDAPAALRAEAHRAIERLSRGEWRPRHALDHNDLWTGNILTDRRADGTRDGSEFPFYVIDWPLANVRGFGVYDLLRLSRSLRLGPRALRRRLLEHAAAWEEAPEHLPGRLVASLGWLEEHRGRVPSERFRSLFRACWDRLVATGLAGGAA